MNLTYIIQHDDHKCSIIVRLSASIFSLLLISVPSAPINYPHNHIAKFLWKIIWH